MSSPGTDDVTDAQRKILDPLIPEPERRSEGRGRPWRDRRSGVLRGLLEAFIEGVRPGEKRRLQVGKTKRGKGTKIRAVADACSLPIV